MDQYHNTKFCDQEITLQEDTGSENKPEMTDDSLEM